MPFREPLRYVSLRRWTMHFTDFADAVFADSHLFSLGIASEILQEQHSCFTLKCTRIQIRLLIHAFKLQFKDKRVVKTDTITRCNRDIDVDKLLLLNFKSLRFIGPRLMDVGGNAMYCQPVFTQRLGLLYHYYFTQHDINGSCS